MKYFKIVFDLTVRLLLHINYIQFLQCIQRWERARKFNSFFFVCMCVLYTAALEPFGKISEQLLQDVQERLVFRAHLYFKTDILEFHPSGGDLAYPEMLAMMKVGGSQLFKVPNL